MLNFSKDYLTGKVNVLNHPDFVNVPPETCDDGNHFLLTDVCKAWLEMHKAASDDGIHLQIISSFRSFDKQKHIWENKWFGRVLTEGENLDKENIKPDERARKIMRYSAMPGTSRHHWGTDIDINDLEDEYFSTGRGLLEYQWLCKNAFKFGFAQPYTKKNNHRPTGYEEEKWHWSYLPAARSILEAYNNTVNYNVLSGFEGAETAKPLQILEKYVNGIDPYCK